jgi:membrane protease subunit HflK
LAQGGESTDQRVKRSVARTLGNAALALIVVGVLGAWAYLGFYTLDPGQAAILLRFGEHQGTVAQAGLHWTLPPPIVSREVVNVGEVRNEDFGLVGRGAGGEGGDRVHESSMQTSDNNIVRVSFAVQYRIADPYAAIYKVEDRVSVVRSAATAAMREVVGRMTVDGVLRERRAALTAEVETILQKVLDEYGIGIDVQAVELQDVQPPDVVRAAFDDVVAATQDANRVVNEAEGYRNQVLPNARAEATELIEQAAAYRDSKIAQATGEATAFAAVYAEYRKAPDVTRKRLYLETMEKVLPPVEKVIIQSDGGAPVLPYLPLGRDGAPAR